jgi:antitoxin ParD1/3/4
MPQPPPLQITLSEAAFEFVQRKIASGEFASPSEVLSESMEILKEQADDQARWEREFVIPAYDRLKADPSSGIPLEEVEQHLAERRRLRSKAS